MTTIHGNLITLAKEGAFDLIVYGCNCFHVSGAGVARAVRENFPQAYAADRATPEGDRAKLGTVSYAEIETEHGPLVVVNGYTQFDYSGDGVLVDYDAVRSVMKEVKRRWSGRRIGYPRIGAGLARGDWAIIASIIEEELAGEDHTLVVLARPLGG